LQGDVALLADGFTARFTPDTNFNGAASFGFTVTDKGFYPQLLLYHDFEPSDTPADSQASDRSGNARPGTFEDVGSGSFTYVTNVVPPALALYDLVSLRLNDNGDDNAARLYRTVTSSEFDFNNSDWTFACWVRRDTTNTRATASAAAATIPCNSTGRRTPRGSFCAITSAPPTT
jgi:hypothetical protein